MTERKLTIAALAAVGLVALGAGLLAQQNGSQRVGRPGQSEPKQGTALDRGLKILTEARIATAREILARDLERIRLMGRREGDFSVEIPSWSHRLMADRLRSSVTEAERLAAIREHRDRMKDLEGLVGAYARTGQGHVSDSLKATYYRLEADQLLVEAGGQDVSQVQLPDLPKGVNAAQPQSAPSTTPR